MTRTMSMKRAAAVFFLLWMDRAHAQSNPNLDQFNYRRNEFAVTNDYGPDSWENVRCTNLETCVSLIDVLCSCYCFEFRKGFMDL
jgi:hypothetical protein